MLSVSSRMGTFDGGVTIQWFTSQPWQIFKVKISASELAKKRSTRTVARFHQHPYTQDPPLVALPCADLVGEEGAWEFEPS